MKIQTVRQIPTVLRFQEIVLVELDGVTRIYVGNEDEVPNKIY